MATIDVNITELTSAADSLRRSAAEFSEAVATLKNATVQLSASWAGSKHDAFDASMNDQFVWFGEMQALMEEYADMLKRTAAKYQDLDSAAAASL